MKKILSVFLALVVLLSVIPMTAAAGDRDEVIQPGWDVVEKYEFYDANGNNIGTPADGLAWTIFPWWIGMEETLIYDTNGSGKYVTATISGNKFRVYFGNSDENCNTNVNIYVDGQLKSTYNIYTDGGTNVVTVGEHTVNYTEVELETAGEHTIKVLNGGGEGHNGMPFNCIAYCDTITSVSLEDASFYQFYDAEGQFTSIGSEGCPWSVFPWWTAEGNNIFETYTVGCMVSTVVNCYAFRVAFGNGNSDCNSNAEIYVDGELVFKYNPSTTNGCANATPVIKVAPGQHAISVKKVGGAGAMPFAAVQYVKANAGVLPTATDGWKMHHSDDFSFLNIVEAATGKVVTLDEVKDVPGGNCIGTEGGVQVDHHETAGHLCSANSFGIMPNYHIIIKFRGTGIHLGANFRDTKPMGIKMLVDGEEIANPYTGNECSVAFDGTHVIPTIIAGVEGLELDNHVVEIYSTTTVRLSFDWYELPEGTTAYVDMSEAVISYEDADEDGKIDDLVITASAKNDGKQYGIIIGEDNFATKTSMKLAKDGGDPLFTKYCDKYDAILVKNVYGTAEITATNLDGELGDKVIALNWKNMLAYDTFAARVFCIDGDEVMYGPITTVSLTEASSLLPLAE